MKLTYIVYFSLSLLFLSALFNYQHISEYINEYAISSAQERFGAQSVSPEIEKMIKGIAIRMGVTEQLIIRKMNPSCLALFGYANAVTYFPLFFNIVPISNTAFLFISESFLESLTPEEQLFLIGHEMVHIKEHHTQYLNLVLLMLFVALIGILYLATKFVNNFIKANSNRMRYAFVLHYLTASFIIPVVVGPRLVGLAYRRHIEWQADAQCLSLLNAHDGCARFMDRLVTEYKHPMVNQYFDLLSDHPACGQRKEWCLHLQKQLKEKNEFSKHA